MVTLSLHDVGVRYGSKTVLENVTTPQMRGGTLTGVIGPNAAGKSSFLKRIAGLSKGPGEVRYSDTSDAAQSIVYMPQDSNATAAITVYEAILLASKQGSALAVSDRDLALIDEMIALLRIEPIAFRNLNELSGGQRQLVSLAQVLIRKPKVILMDEPTSALDLHRQVEVLSLIDRFARENGIIALIALHDLNHAMSWCEQVIVISEGRMVASGPTTEVIDVDFLRRIYRIEARIERCSLGKPVVIVDRPLS